MSGLTKRKRIYVDHEVQGVLVRQLVLHWMVAGLVMFLFLFVMQVLSSPDRSTPGGYLEAMWIRYSPLFVAMITVFPVFAYDSIKLSHRFAGPMVSFRAALARLARGERINEISFRRKDFWQSISKDLNAIAARLGQLEDGTSDQSTGTAGNSSVEANGADETPTRHPQEAQS